MKKIVIFWGVIVSTIVLFSCNNNYKDVPFQEKIPHDWENPAVSQLNKEEPRAYFIPYATPGELATGNKWASSLIKSLNGTWKFNLSDKPADRPAWFFKDDYDISDWKSITVPGNWELQGFDYPIYTNAKYPHDKTPPIIQDYYNPVGSYKRTFELPQKWNQKEVILHFGAVSSAMYVWVNEQLVG